MFSGHIKVLGGPHVARGSDVAQACSRAVVLNPNHSATRFFTTTYNFWIFIEKYSFLTVKKKI